VYSAVILTLNEEDNLPKCLHSLRECTDIVVLDSGSTDRTCEIARSSGARVVVNRFNNFAQQRNFAHEQISFKHPWLLHLDADEEMTTELHRECDAVGNPNHLDGFWIAPKMLFEGQWLPRCTDYPAWQARFVHVERFRFIEVGHGQREDPSMRMGRLKKNYQHDMTAKGVPDWIDKHHRYARAEALNWNSRPRPNLKCLFLPNALERRRTIKAISYHLPARPLLRFVYQYVLRRGFLDGAAGLRYCRLLALYEKFAVEEIHALRTGQSTEKT
jgi:glycosyltransferase involved in cell wall biosynthesis